MGIKDFAIIFFIYFWKEEKEKENTSTINPHID